MSSPKNRLRLGIIGCGLIARRHARWLAAESRAEVILCCDPSDAAARAFADEFFPGVRIETDALAAIAHEPLEAVILCSPTPRHYEQAREALDRGLHVLAEKPLAQERLALLDLVSRSRDAHRVLTIAHQRRHMPAYATARRELTANAEWYGPVRQVHLFVCERWQATIDGTWRDDPAMNVGYFGDAGIHQVDVVSFITGLRPEAVFAVSGQRGSRVEVVTAVLARLTGGVGLAAHFVGSAQHYREDLHFHCERGDLLVRGEEVWRAKDNQLERITDLVPTSNPLVDFLDAVLEGQPSVAPPEIALPILDWTEGVLTSSREGRWVYLP